MTANTYILEQIGSIKNKRARDLFLGDMLKEDRSMEIRCKDVLESIWWGFISHYASFSLNSKEISAALSALFYMHTSVIAETLCFVGTFLENLEWPKDHEIRKEKRAEIICVFTHGIISGLVTAMEQFTKDLSDKPSTITEKRVAIFIIELLFRQTSLKLDVPDYLGYVREESPSVHDFGVTLEKYLLPDSKFVGKKLRPQLFVKEMKKRKFENVTCKPAKQVMNQILQASFSAIDDYNIRTTLVCRGLR